jgi:hypothetical protein
MDVFRKNDEAQINVYHWRSMVFVRTCQNQSRESFRLVASNFRAIGPCDKSLPAAMSPAPIGIPNQHVFAALERRNRFGVKHSPLKVAENMFLPRLPENDGVL